MDWLTNWFNEQRELFILNFIEEDRWKLLLDGLGSTLLITLFATLIGILLGIIVAAVRTTYDKNGEAMAFHKNAGYYLLKVANIICKLYLTIMRGTPVVVQLLIAYFIIFASSDNGLMVAIIAFGVNSGAYVAENIRAGILSVDVGQTEAGRALGLPGRITMLKIVIPQAIKNVIPAIGNELIALIKETSIVSMIGMYDLTMAAKIIGSGNNMASYIVPMSVVALFYLAIVYLLTFAIKLIEKRLRASDKH